MDAVPEEAESMIGGDMAGLVVVRSLTKTWGLAGLRAGYAVGDPHVLTGLRGQQPPWSVSTPALAVITACLSPEARAMAAEAATEIANNRNILLDLLAGLDLPVAGVPAAPFALIDTSPIRGQHPPGWARGALREAGFAVRRADTFPGLGPDWIRVAVRVPPVSRAFAEALLALDCRSARSERRTWTSSGGGVSFRADLELSGRSVLVCGAGAPALAPIRNLLDASASVTVVGAAPVASITDLAGRGHLILVERAVESGDLASASLIVPATGDAALDSRIVELARQAAHLRDPRRFRATAGGAADRIGDLGRRRSRGSRSDYAGRAGGRPPGRCHRVRSARPLSILKHASRQPRSSTSPKSRAEPIPLGTDQRDLGRASPGGPYGGSTEGR